MLVSLQLNEVSAVEKALAAEEDKLAQLETLCRKHTHSGYIQDPQMYKVNKPSFHLQDMIWCLSYPFQPHVIVTKYMLAPLNQ